VDYVPQDIIVPKVVFRRKKLCAVSRRDIVRVATIAQSWYQKDIFQLEGMRVQDMVFLKQRKDISHLWVFFMCVLQEDMVLEMVRVAHCAQECVSEDFSALQAACHP
jgi:hypothetical protein